MPTVDLERLSVELVANDLRYRQQLERSARATENWANRVERQTRLVRNSFAGIAGIGIVREIVRLGDAYTNVQNRLTQVTNSQAELNVANEDAFRIAIETRSNLEATAQLYARTARQADKLGLSQMEVADLISYGATTQEATSATIQLSQALGKGALNGDEFRTISEAAPPILAAIAREAGVAEGALKDMGAQGLVTAELVTRGVLAAREQFGADFAQTVGTFSQNLEVARTTAVAFVGTSERLADVGRQLGSGLIFLSQNIDTFVGIAEVAVVVVGSRLVGSFTTATAALVAQQVQAARTALTMNALNSVYSGTTVAAGRAAVAMTGLSRAMALMGGPVGVVALAAASLFTFVFNAESAIDRTQRLTETARKMNEEFANVSKAALQLEIAGLQEVIVARQEQIQRLEQQIRDVPLVSRRNQEAAAVEATARINNINAQIRAIQELDDVDRIRLGELRAQLAELRREEAGAQQIANAGVERFIGRLQRQSDLYGQISQVARVRYEIENGALKAANEEQRKRALLLAEELDMKKQLEMATRREAEIQQALQQSESRAASERESILSSQERVVELEEFRARRRQEELDRELADLRERGLLTKQLESQIQNEREMAEAAHQERLRRIAIENEEKIRALVDWRSRPGRSSR